MSSFKKYSYLSLIKHPLFFYKIILLDAWTKNKRFGLHELFLATVGLQIISYEAKYTRY